jgi:hypothetical protein
MFYSATRSLQDSNDENPYSSSQQSFTRLVRPPTRSNDLDVSPQCSSESLGVFLLQLVPLPLCFLNDDRSCSQISVKATREKSRGLTSEENVHGLEGTT